MLKFTYSNLEFQNFPGRTPDPLFKGRGGKGKEGGEGKKDREGKEEWGWWGGEGGSAWAPPPRDKLWIRP